MVQIDAGSKEAKVIRVLLDRYPIDADTISKETGIPLPEVKRILKGMEDRGWVQLEILPDRTFVRLRRFDFTFLGRVETQKRAVKHKRGHKEKEAARAKVLRDDHDDIMYA
jgi:DNA-binding MarR family transcriptional regulator